VREPHECPDAGEAGEDLRVDRSRPLLKSLHRANDNPSRGTAERRRLGAPRGRMATRR
jgi:hypothetical protein